MPHLFQRCPLQQCLAALLLPLSALLSAHEAPAPARKPSTLRHLIDSQAAGSCTTAGPGLLLCHHKLTFKALKDVDVVGEGLRILFTNPERAQGGMEFNQAQNVRVSGFSLGWKDSLLDAGSSDSQPNPIFSIARASSCPGGAYLTLPARLTGSLPVDVISTWDVKRGWPWSFDALPPIDIYFKKGHFTMGFHEGQSACMPELATLATLAGQTALIRHHVSTNHALQCIDCSNVVVEKVGITSAPGMGFVFIGGRDITLRDNVVAPACAPACPQAMPSLTADASHFVSVTGQITIERNDFSFQGDDGINIASMMMVARLKPDQEHGARVARPILGHEWLMGAFKSGMPISAYGKNLALIAKGRVKLNANDHLVIELDTELEEVLLSAQPPDKGSTMIQYNHLHDNRARGILATVDNVTIQFNNIERTTQNGILLAADTKYFYEGPGADNVRIANNKLANTNRARTDVGLASPISVGGITPFAGLVPSSFHNICITGNKVQQQPGDTQPPISNPYKCND